MRWVVAPHPSRPTTTSYPFHYYICSTEVGSDSLWRRRLISPPFPDAALLTDVGFHGILTVHYSSVRMASGGGDDEEKIGDLYAVLGIDRECSASDLKTAYKKLALKWHPDRCFATGSPTFEAKNKFQEIQEAYSVLSDTNKRFLYDLGVYENDVEEDDGMCEFLGEMAAMMTKSQPCETATAGESFEKLQELFFDMFQSDAASSSSYASTQEAAATVSSSSSSESFSFAASAAPTYCGGNSGCCLKRDYSCSAAFSELFDSDGNSSCFGAPLDWGSSTNSSGSKRRSGRKQKVRSGHDVSSTDVRRSAA